jgi:Fe-S cluster biogenesis protein NfuA
MTAPNDVAGVGERVEQLIAELRASTDPRAADVADELVGSLVALYGAGLARVVELVGAEALAADPLVEALLLVHDLHPLDVETRVRRALAAQGGNVELLGIDENGLVRLRLTSTGCGSSAASVRAAVERAVQDAAPETTGIELEEAERRPVLLQIGRRAPAGAR